MGEVMNAPANVGYGYNAFSDQSEDSLELSYQKLISAIKNHWILITALTLVFCIRSFWSRRSIRRRST